MRRLTQQWPRNWGFRPGLRRHDSPQTVDRDAPDFPFTLVADDDVPEPVRANAVKKLAHVARFAPRPVLHARLTLHTHRDPARPRPAIAKAALDVSGSTTRAYVAAATLIEASDLVAERLRRKLDDLDEVRHARRHDTGVAGPGKWRHGDRSAARTRARADRAGRA